MTEKPTVTLNVVDGSTAGEYYDHSDIVRFGFENYEEFSIKCVFVSYRVEFKEQSFNIRVWFKKSDAHENDWIKHARKKIPDLVMWTKEAVDEWRAS